MSPAYLMLPSLTCNTLKLFGVELTPHLFRDIAATYLAVHCPEAVRSASAVLGHWSPHTSERNNNQATMLSALRAFMWLLANIGESAQSH